MSEKKRYLVLFWIDWKAGWLWSGEERTWEQFGYGSLEDELPISESLRKRGDELAEWYDTSLNWDNPSYGPGPWRQDECERFKVAARAFFDDLREELQDDFEVIYRQGEPNEDPDLDEYLRDPVNFRRKVGVGGIKPSIRTVSITEIFARLFRNLRK